MTDSISLQLENGFNQLFCISSTDDESFLNDNISPEKRIRRQQQFESYLIDEMIPFIRDQNPISFLIVVGVDTGGYHALNMALKYPRVFGKAIGISGVYDIRPFMDDYYDENMYYNVPVDYIPNLSNDNLLDNIRQIDIRLVSYRNDPRKEVTYRLSDIFRTKMIDHELDVWNMESEEEWDLWRQMLKVHIV